MNDCLCPVRVVAGPTASGKSALALDLAQREQGVIINADSLQIYNSLPILTATPSAAEQDLAPHSLYGVLKPNQSITAMDWAKLAQQEISKAFAAGKKPIIVGGTGFYLKTLMEGLSPIPQISPAVRVLAQDLFDKIGLVEFFAELQRADPIIAAKIDRHNPQRLVRAMEVFMGTGKPLSYWQELPPIPVDPDLKFDIQLIMPERDDLYRRCDRRFDMMIKNGALEEVRAFDEDIMAGKVEIDAALTHALGFKPLQDYLRGNIDLESAIYLAKSETRHYAKRQTTWFRHQLTQPT